MRIPALQFSSRRARRSPPRWRVQPSRGAVLIVALLLAALIAVALGSYLNLNLSSSRLARQSFNGFAALNLAEAGAEEAVWSFNRARTGDAVAWSSWTNNGVSAWQKFTNFNFGENAGGWVKVYVDKFNPGANARPRIVAQSSVGGSSDTNATKMIEVTLRRRSLFANGIVARDSIVFSGSNTSVDSWNSDPDQNPATPPIPFSTAVRTDNGTVGSTSVLNTAVLVNNANVWGYVATGGAAPQVGSGGSVRGPNTPAGVMIDPTRISTDFNADFDGVLVPLDGTFIATLPAVLGTVGAQTKWRTPTLTLAGNETLTVRGDVTLILTAGTGNAVSLTGNAAIILSPGASLTMYVAADVRIAGNGIANPNVQPISCQILGVSTTPAGQDIHVAGNGSLTCVVYAPNGDVTVNGNGDVMGSIVARSIRFTGNAAFHFDEALAERDSNQPFSISKWRELSTASERAAYQSLFQGW